MPLIEFIKQHATAIICMALVLAALFISLLYRKKEDISLVVYFIPAGKIIVLINNLSNKSVTDFTFLNRDIFKSSFNVPFISNVPAWAHKVIGGHMFKTKSIVYVSQAGRHFNNPVITKYGPESQARILEMSVLCERPGDEKICTVNFYDNSSLPELHSPLYGIGSEFKINGISPFSKVEILIELDVS